MMARATNEAVNSAGVLSLSAKPGHILMWSHYANSHRGICIRFRASSNTPFFGRAQRVIYQTMRPVLNLIRDTPVNQSEKALLTKADFWDYEEEWRIIEHAAGPGVHKFPAGLLDGVILGARIYPENEKRIIEMINLRGEETRVLKAQSDPHAFRIRIPRRSSLFGSPVRVMR
jgi:hypothetical protein